MAAATIGVGKVSRCDFLKLMAAAGSVMTFTPFVEWGKFLPNPRSSDTQKARVEIPDGSQANIDTFPVNHSETVIYPKANDPVLNKEAFRTWQLIRLPREIGGDRNDVGAFRMYSMVCLHLWCLWKYFPRGPDPENPSKVINGNGQCPCHGSMYDIFTGKAYQGPAALQGPPSNVLPRLDLEVDGDGYLWILPANWSVDGNGIVGYGRFLKG
jgi:ubiquinol-cytochrome c reductase iron-sulfur subunit